LSLAGHKCIAGFLVTGGRFMKRIVALFLVLGCIIGIYAQGNQSKRILFLYDEDNEKIEPYKTMIENELNMNGLQYDVSNVQNIQNKDITAYDTIIIYSIVMAFNTNSPIRNWLNTKPDLANKKVGLLVTANRWFLNNLLNGQMNLLKKQQATIIDAVSSATKDLTEPQKAALIKNFIRIVKDKI
jgi:hypothetical protein